MIPCILLHVYHHHRTPPLIVSATVSDGKLFIDGVNVLGEVESTNGNVVEIAQPAYSSDLGLPTQNVMEIARQQGFTLFAELFDRAGLLAQVEQGKGPFTVFAVDDGALLAAVEEFPELYPADGAGGNTVSKELRQILLNHVGVAPQVSLFGDVTTFYRGTGSGIKCEGIALPLGDSLAITIADICLPFSIDTMQVRQSCRRCTTDVRYQHTSLFLSPFPKGGLSRSCL
jgi:hypothetical protein